MNLFKRKKKKTSKPKPPKILGEIIHQPLRQLPRINVVYGEKVNTGGYESINVSFSKSADIKPGHDEFEAYCKLYDEVKGMFKRALDEKRITSIHNKPEIEVTKYE
jgi:hypothetical protein